MSSVLLFSRKAGDILVPQFWAEDGAVWYADAYNHGVLYSLATPENGYFQTFSRLVAILSLPFPLEVAPTIFMALSFAVQVAVAVFITSSRMATLIPSSNWRLVLAFFYLSMPHAPEVFVNVTNSQWHLALLGCLILLALPPEGKFWKALDYAVLTIMALSGPFCLMLAPVALAQFIRKRDSYYGTCAAIVIAGGSVQFLNYLIVGREVPRQLGASVDLFVQILSRHVLIGPMIGERGFRSFLKYLPWNAFVYFSIAILGLAVYGYTLLRGSAELRLLLLFTVCILAATLATPAVTLEMGQWAAMANLDTAFRYWFIPSFTLYACLIFFASRSEVNGVRQVAAMGLMISLIGAALNWKIRSMKDLHFQEHAAKFENAPAGAKVAIPINPEPDWKMVLRKR